MVIGAQSTPLACFSMKFTFSEVISSAATTRSPSFSRSSSSTMMTNSPLRKSSIASSIVFSLIFSIMILIVLECCFDSFLYIAAILDNGFQILVQAYAIAPDIQPDKQSGRNDDSNQQIQPAVVRYALMGLYR